MNVPTLYIPPGVRTYVYLGYGLLALVAFLFQVGYAAVPLDSPTWLRVATAVISALGPAIGVTAATHVPSAPDAAADTVAARGARAVAARGAAVSPDVDHAAG